MSSGHDDRRSEVVLARELFESFMSRSLAQLTYPFMEEVDPDALGLKDYRSIVTEPMWLKKMEEKFNDGIYQNIREFVCDFRLMLLNCYRYNGVASRIGRMAEKLELLFEQKLQLMPQDIRAKTSIQATLGSGTAEDELSENGLSRRRSSNRLFVSGDSRQLTPMRAIMDELEHAIQPGAGGVTASLITASNDPAGFNSSSAHQSMSMATSAEDRVAILVARLSLWRVRRQEEALLTSWQSWWTERKGSMLQDTMDRTLELLEAYQFLWLADPFLGISDSMAYCQRHARQSEWHPSSIASADHSRGLCLFDLELGLSLAPQASQLLATCMTILLATPKERAQFIAALSSDPVGDAGNAEDSTDPQQSSAASRRQRGGQQNALASVRPWDYRVWERRLAARVESWYRALWDRGKGRLVWATRRLGLPPHFFRICGTRQSPLEKHQFHELPVYQRIQILHSLCENTLRIFDNLRQSLDKSADWDAAKPFTLGSDLFDNVIYVHFPGMLDSEPASRGRVYRLCRVRSDPVDIHSDDLYPKQQQQEPTSAVESNTNTVPYDEAFKSSASRSSPSSSSSEDDSLSHDGTNTTESTGPPSSVRGRRSMRGKRRRTFTRVKGGTSGAQSELVQHNQLVAEWGLPVPGPVGRLPNWMDPSLARCVCRRWFGIVQRLEAESAAALSEAAKTQTTTGRKPVTPLMRPVDTSGLDELASYPILSLGRGRGRGRGRGGLQSLMASTPFAGFAKKDDETLERMLADEPALEPSPLATLNGLSQRYLSLQLGRGYALSCRGGSKSGMGSRTGSTMDLENAPITDGVDTSTVDGGDEQALSSVASPLDDLMRNDDEDDDADDYGDNDTSMAVDADSNVNGGCKRAGLNKIGICKATKVGDEEKDHDISADNSMLKEDSEASDNNDDPCDTSRTESESLNQVKREPMDSVTQRKNTCPVDTPPEKLIPEDSNGPVKSEHLPSATVPDTSNLSEPTDRFATNELIAASSLETKPLQQDSNVTTDSEEKTKEQIDADVPEESEEDLIKEPDENAFFLVARDRPGLETLIQRLKTVLVAAEAKLATLFDSVTTEPSRDLTSTTPDEVPIGSPHSASSSSDSDSSLSSLSSLSSRSSRKQGGKSPVKRKRRARSPCVTKDPIDPRRKRYEDAIRALQELIANLEKLYRENASGQTECEDARQLARLRLRKDVEAWNTLEGKRLKEVARSSNAEQNKQQQSDSLITQSDLAKERAERLQRRKQRRVMESDDSDSDSQSTSTMNSSRAADVQSPRPVPRNSPSAKPWRVNSPGTHSIPILRINKDTGICSFVPTPSRSTSALAQTVIPELHPVGAGWAHDLHAASRPNKSPSVLPASFTETTRIRYGLMPPIYTVRPQLSFYSSPSTRPTRPTPTTIPNGTLQNLPRPSITSTSTTTVAEAPPPAVTTSTTTPATIAGYSTTQSAAATRKVYRVSDTLFTDDAMPVYLDPNGSLQPLPIESVPENLRQLARQMIARYKQHQSQKTQQQSLQQVPQQQQHQQQPPTGPKCVNVTTGQITP